MHIVLYTQADKNAQFPVTVDVPRTGQDLQRKEKDMVLDSRILGFYLTK